MDLKKDFNRLVSKLFEHDPNLSLVNTSWPKPQTTYDENTDYVDDFWQQVAKFVFNVSNLPFSQVTTLQTETISDKVENLQPRFGSPLRGPYFDLCSTLLWVLIHTLATTGLDLLTNQCGMLRRQVGLFLNFLRSHGNIRLWLRFRKYTTVSHFA